MKKKVKKSDQKMINLICFKDFFEIIVDQKVS